MAYSSGWVACNFEDNIYLSVGDERSRIRSHDCFARLNTFSQAQGTGAVDPTFWIIRSLESIIDAGSVKIAYTSNANSLCEVGLSKALCFVSWTLFIYLKYYIIEFRFSCSSYIFPYIAFLPLNLKNLQHRSKFPCTDHSDLDRTVSCFSLRQLYREAAHL